jgi:hypothetical protein
MATLGNAIFVGDASGVIYEAETGGSDDGQTYTARVAGLWTDLRAPLVQKRVTMVRGTFRANVPQFNPLWSISTDFNNTFKADPSAGANAPAVLWGSAVWGAAEWGGGIAEYRTSEWTAVDGIGDMVSWQLQVTLGSIVSPDIELASIGVLYETGETVA